MNDTYRLLTLFITLNLFSTFGHTESTSSELQWLVPVSHEPIYFDWDNERVADYDDLIEDPLLAIRTKIGGKDLPYDILASWSAFALLQDRNSSLTFDKRKREFLDEPSLIFDHCSISFQVPLDRFIWWQMSPDPEFQMIPSHLNQVQPPNECVCLSLLAETFINPSQPYYFRFCEQLDGQWGKWSEVQAFTQYKPERVEMPVFEKKGDAFEISWEKKQNGNTQYLIFASNSRDFVPSIYYDKHLISMDETCQELVPNYSYLYSTSSNKIRVDGSFAYYRIITEKNGAYSIPSPLIYLYDAEFDLSPNILKPHSSSGLKRQPIRAIALELHEQYNGYIQNPHVSPQVWERMSKYFLPANHPLKNKLDKLFGEKRITLDQKHLKEGGFKSPALRDHSRTVVSQHKKFRGYYFKFFSDEQRNVVDWKKLLNRVVGAQKVRDVIRKHHYEKYFKVPDKWIYPLPAEPSPPSNYLRKNFILIAQDVSALKFWPNYAKWKSTSLSKSFLSAFFRILSDAGLYDSVHPFNVPFTFDGRAAFIDTEVHSKWPIPYEKLTPRLSDENQVYWNQLIQNSGGSQ